MATFVIAEAKPLMAVFGPKFGNDCPNLPVMPAKKCSIVCHKVPGLQLAIAFQPICNDSHLSPRNIAHPLNLKLLRCFF